MARAWHVVTLMRNITDARRAVHSVVALAGTCALCATLACGGSNTPPPGSTPGAPRSGTTAALETGAEMLQATPPVDQIAMYLDGFHAAKDNPQMQMESHHYCNQVNEDFAQCVLFDGNTAEARLHGVEYIISSAVYARLAPEERGYWHPHNYEVLSGQLRMPGLPDAAEKAALRTKVNSYGKTWHFWMTGTRSAPGDQLPLGPPHLAWSFNRDGELDATLLAARDERMHLDTAEARRQRQDLIPLAAPQGGVDALAAAFPAGVPFPGVRDNGDTSARPVPTVGFAPAPMPKR